MHDARKLVFQSLLNPCHALQHCPGPACSICGFIMVRMNCTQLQHACGWSGLINLKPQSTSSHPQPKRSAAEPQSNSWCGSGGVGWGIEFVVRTVRPRFSAQTPWEAVLALKGARMQAAFKVRLKTEDAGALFYIPALERMRTARRAEEWKQKFLFVRPVYLQLHLRKPPPPTRICTITGETKHKATPTLAPPAHHMYASVSMYERMCVCACVRTSIPMYAMP